MTFSLFRKPTKSISNGTSTFYCTTSILLGKGMLCYNIVYMDDDEIEKKEQKSGDSNCPRCGLRTYEDPCPSCGAPMVDKKDDEDEEYDWRERRGGRTRL